MKMLIVSDTHGRHGNLDVVLEREKGIDVLIHLGDVEGDEHYIESVVKCPVHVIAGNNDFFSHLSREKEIRIGKYKIWLTHGHTHYVSMDKKILREEARARGIDIVMFGHTHKPYLETESYPMMLNPGSISYPRQEGRKPSYIVMEMDENGEAKFELKYV